MKKMKPLHTYHPGVTRKYKHRYHLLNCTTYIVVCISNVPAYFVLHIPSTFFLLKFNLYAKDGGAKQTKDTGECRSHRRKLTRGPQSNVNYSAGVLIGCFPKQGSSAAL